MENKTIYLNYYFKFFNDEKIQIFDPFAANREFKKTILIPHLRKTFEDLTCASKFEVKSISKLQFKEVSIISILI